MAKRTTVLLEDDLDGGKAEETVTFGLDGKAFEIDLSAKNAEKLRKILAGYIKAGRRAGRSTVQARRVPSARDGSAGDSAAIRAWAHENGYEVSARGRISASLRETYRSSG